MYIYTYIYIYRYIDIYIYTHIYTYIYTLRCLINRGHAYKFFDFFPTPWTLLGPLVY